MIFVPTIPIIRFIPCLPISLGNPISKKFKSPMNNISEINTITMNSKDRNALRIIVPSYNSIDNSNNNKNVTEIKTVEFELKTPAKYNVNAAVEYPQIYVNLYS